MSNSPESSKPIQRTLDGDNREIEYVECEYYDGCRGDAEFVLDQLVYGEGQVDVLACESCRDEFLEVYDEEKVRELSISERLAEP